MLFCFHIFAFFQENDQPDDAVEQLALICKYIVSCNGVNQYITGFVQDC